LGVRILVTGASGSLGRVVTEALLNAGYDVRGQFARAPGASPWVEWRQVDFMTSLVVDDLVRDCVGVVNLVGEVSVAARMYRLNVEAPRALLDAASKADVRYFGHASSISVYGSPARRVLDEESETIDPDCSLDQQVFESPSGIEYARTKLLGERALRRAPSVSRVDIYRIAKSAGFDLFLEATRWGLARRLLSLHGNSHCIFERDCADAIVFLMARGLDGGGAGVETFNIADPEAGTHARALGYFRSRSRGKPECSPFFLPPFIERLKNAVKYRSLASRLPIAMARVRTDRLAAAGFHPTVGYARALELAVDDRLARGVG
jgi:nucleoside-diphosphate-sugar epimerase